MVISGIRRSNNVEAKDMDARELARGPTPCSWATISSKVKGIGVWLKHTSVAPWGTCTISVWPWPLPTEIVTYIRQLWGLPWSQRMIFKILSPLRLVGVCNLLPALTFTHNKLLGEGDSEPAGRSVDAECPMRITLGPRKKNQIISSLRWVFPGLLSQAGAGVMSITSQLAINLINLADLHPCKTPLPTPVGHIAAVSFWLDSCFCSWSHWLLPVGSRWKVISQSKDWKRLTPRNGARHGSCRPNIESYIFSISRLYINTMIVQAGQV